MLNTRLLEAVENRNPEEVKRLLTLGANPNATCRLTHISACHVAAMNNDDSLSVLLKAGAESQRTDKLGRTPLHLAAWAGNPVQLVMLLNLPEDLQSRITVDISEIVHEIQMYRDATYAMSNKPCDAGTLYDIHSPWLDLELVSLEAIEDLMNAGDSPLLLDSSGRTAMHICVEKLLREHLQVLLSYICNNPDSHITINIKDKKGLTVLHAAVRAKWIDGVYITINAGASVLEKADDGEFPIHSAAATGDVFVLREIITATESAIDIINQNGQTALFVAIIHNHVEAVKMLVRYGASLEVTLPNNQSILHVAAQHGFTEILAFLLNDGGPAICSLFRSQYIQPPIYSAVINNHPECVRLLLYKGGEADCIFYHNTINEKSEWTTALHIAAVNNYLETARIIIEFDNATVNRPNDGGLLPLHEACLNGSRDVIILLINNGADLSVSSKYVDIAPIQILMNNVTDPTEFIQEILNHSISLEGVSLKDRECKVKVDYSVLMPDGSGGNQMRVVRALVNTEDAFDQRKLLQHPLIQSFLYLKWKMFLPFYYITVLFTYPFEGPWAAFIKVMVMMMSEYDYTNMITKQNAIELGTSILVLRIVFIAFVVFASVVLMNLMIGLAVNDIDKLQERDCTIKILASKSQQGDYVESMEGEVSV
ncbi:uncharacterized protein LOC142982790 [Anticarsia gemmatalis]|uniref:uncharacterized protein LOC142982790 n=1 Tax=Anticarsia gemmatalis TaxID=129554 RepID=UPI003F775D78